MNIVWMIELEMWESEVNSKSNQINVTFLHIFTDNGTQVSNISVKRWIVCFYLMIVYESMYYTIYESGIKHYGNKKKNSNW